MEERYTKSAFITPFSSSGVFSPLHPALRPPAFPKIKGVVNPDLVLSLFCYFGESKIRKSTHTAIAKLAGEARKLFMKLSNLRNPRWKPGILNTCNQGEIKQ